MTEEKKEENKEVFIVTKTLSEKDVVELNKKITTKNEIIKFMREFYAGKSRRYVNISYFDSYPSSGDRRLSLSTDVYDDASTNPNKRTSWPHLDAEETQEHFKKFRNWVDDAVMALYREKIAVIDEYLRSHGIKVEPLEDMKNAKV